MQNHAPISHLATTFFRSENFHSMEDWDWPDGLARTFDLAVFVEPPSSWRLTAAALGQRPVLCREETTLVLPVGRIVFWARISSLQPSGPLVSMRNQAPLDTATDDNMYWIMSISSRLYLYRRVADANTLLVSWPFAWVINTWYHFRVTWWEEAGTFLVRVEYWDGAEWLSLVPDGSDAVNQWSASEINRCGVGHVRGTYTTTLWLDEIEIWKPA